MNLIMPGEDQVIGSWPEFVVVYAQWVPDAPGELPDRRVLNWFHEIGRMLNVYSHWMI